MRARSDERGLIGKLVVLWLVAAVLAVIVALDVGSILLTRYRTANLAQEVAFAASERFAATGDVDQARAAARQAIRSGGSEARLRRLDVNGGEVTVVVVARADAILLDLLPLTEELTTVTVTDTAAPSGG